MTAPTEKRTFEERLSVLLCRLTKGKWSKPSDVDSMISVIEEAQEETIEKERAEEREITIQEVLGLLRDNFKNPDFEWGPPRKVADWLESKLAQSVHPELTDSQSSEPAVVMKDESFKLPEYY